MDKYIIILILIIFLFYYLEKNKKYDIVITWVNLTGEKYDYIEIKYLLRSLQKHKINYRNIYIIHREKQDKLYGYPEFLKENTNLHFISHKELGADYEISRACQIPFLFNKIPNLSNIFFHIEDDQFIMNKLLFDNLLNENSEKKIKIRKAEYYNYDEYLYSKEQVKGWKQWHLGQMNASKFFNMEKYSFDIHNIKLYNKQILNEIERMYPKIWDDSKKLIYPLPNSPYRCNLWSLYSSYVLCA